MTKVSNFVTARTLDFRPERVDSLADRVRIILPPTRHPLAAYFQNALLSLSEKVVFHFCDTEELPGPRRHFLAERDGPERTRTPFA